MRAILGLLCSFLSCLPAQQEGPSVERDYEQLMAGLEPPNDPPPERLRQIEAMRAFLHRHEREDTHDRVLKVRTRLGTALLHACEFERARTQFATVLAKAPPAQHDLVGRARYGQAQALELLDKPEEARSVLKEIIEVHAGLRYARYAKTALARLQEGVTKARAGEPAPELGKDVMVDLEGRPHRLQVGSEAVMLVFWSPDVPASITRLQAAVEAWQRGGGNVQSVLAMAVAASSTQVEQARKAYLLSTPIVPCIDEFVHPALLAYRVTKLPTVVVVAPDATVVGRDLPNRTIEHLARTLR